MTKLFDQSDIEKFHSLVSTVIDINFFTSDFCNKFLEENKEYDVVIVHDKGIEKVRFGFPKLKITHRRND